LRSSRRAAPSRADSGRQFRLVEPALAPPAGRGRPPWVPLQLAVRPHLRVVRERHSAQQLGHGDVCGSGAGASTNCPAAPTYASPACGSAVSVPVLSEQMIVTDPSDSTAGSLRTSALRLAIFPAPIASATGHDAGSASGIAATARLTDVRNMSASGSRAAGRDDTIAQMPRAASARRLPKCARCRCSGVWPRCGWISAADATQLGGHARPPRQLPVHDRT